MVNYLLKSTICVENYESVFSNDFLAWLRLLSESLMVGKHDMILPQFSLADSFMENAGLECLETHKIWEKL